ncbi:MAG: alpha/beta fold hydrolase [Aestuariivirga sp.]
MPKLDLGHVQLNFLQRGEGPDIVWVPGGDSTIDLYREQYPFFEKRFRLTSFDPRGAGETICRKEPPWTIADMAADCAALIRAVCKPPVILTGLSMGALITQQVAIDYPSLVRLAIPMGTGANFRSGYSRDFMVADVEFRRAGGRLSRDMAAVYYGVLCYPSEVLGNKEMWARVKELLGREYGDRNSEDLEAQWEACINFDCDDGLKACPVPIHVIAFGEDVQAPPAVGKQVADLAPNGHFHLMPGLGHCSLAIHRPDEVNRKLLEIIDNNL